MKLMHIPSGGLLLAAAVEAPEHPRAAVVLVHGMAEHKERYFPFMNYLAGLGFACVIADLRGHGATAAGPEELGYFGKRGDELLVEDTRQVILWTKSQYPGVKLFLFGHSMGSLIVRCFAKKYDQVLDGLIVCGSPSRSGMAGVGITLTRCIRLFKGDRYRSALLESMTTGSYGKKFAVEDLPNSWLSVNKTNVQAYNEDPLCGFRFTVNGYRALLQLLEDTYDPDDWTVARPALPVHFIAGAEDPCIGSIKKFSQAVSFFRGRGYRQVSSKIYPNMRHEILNESGREEVWRDVADILASWA